MEALGFTLAGDGTLHIHVKGTSKAVSPDASNYEAVLAALRMEDWEEVETLLTPFKDLQESNDRVGVVHGVMTLTDDDGEEFAVPTPLADEIRRYTDLDLNCTRLLTFAKNLNMNHSNNSVQQLYGWLKEANLTLTEDGCFIAYKKVSQDFKDLRTVKFNNAPGETPKMNRNLVNEDTNNSCSHGLHVATYDYAHSFGSGSGRVVAVKVHPKDVVAVPNSEKQKMRCCEYLVLEESFAEMDRPTYEVSEDEEEEETCDGCGLFESDCCCDDDCDDCGYHIDNCECYD